MTASPHGRTSFAARCALTVVVGAAGIVVASPGVGRAAPAPGSCPTAFVLVPIAVGTFVDKNSDGLVCRVPIGDPGPFDWNYIDNNVQGY